MQPSGLMHLGNHLGALENWKSLQDQYECYFFVADWHALSTNYADTSRIREFSRELLIDWLAAGIDPERSTGFYPIPHPGTCGLASIALNDDAHFMAGAQSNVQRKAGRN
jgi:tryptophanyl-tRNA synthetase